MSDPEFDDEGVKPCTCCAWADSPISPSCPQHGTPLSHVGCGTGDCGHSSHEICIRALTGRLIRVTEALRGCVAAHARPYGRTWIVEVHQANHRAVKVLGDG